jgi:hypothetical protein
MPTLTITDIELKFKEIENKILDINHYSTESYYSKIVSKSWNGILFEWKAQPLKNGGKLKRNRVYGNIHYSYNNQELTRQEAIEECLKPASLRQALIEAQTSIECSMCGLAVVGIDAMNPYQSTIFWNGEMYKRKAWGVLFFRLNDNNEPITLKLCPDCMQRIANGEFRNGND